MFTLNEEEFRALVSEAIDNIPKKYSDKLDNVGFVVEDVPTLEQREKLKLRNDQSLFGLYEGIPLTKRGAGYNLVLPDKITVFKLPMEARVNNLAELKEQLGRTIWHEVAHYYGLGHPQIYELERKEREKQ